MHYERVSNENLRIRTLTWAYLGPIFNLNENGFRFFLCKKQSHATAALNWKLSAVCSINVEMLTVLRKNFLVDMSDENSSTVFYIQFSRQRKLLHSIKANAWSGAALNSTYWFYGNLKLLRHLFLPLYPQLSIFQPLSH